MSGEAQISFTGTAGDAAQLRFTPAGAAVANLSVAVTARVKDGDTWKDSDTAWYRVTVWRDFAERVGESVRKGDRVTVVGRLTPREYEKDGAKRMSLDVDAESVALDLRFRAARTAERTDRGTPDPRIPTNARGGSTERDPWASPAPATAAAAQPGGWGTIDDQPPF